ncbi:MAG: hypothetical protein O8C64_07035 [Candidatus Methanoperedens sp.]|nr:hypothetical protein [Candidatus Methanoperedens sp.]
MAEKIAENSYFKRSTRFIKSIGSSLILGLSGSLNGGVAYSYIISLDYHYFTPADGIIAGLIGGFGVGAKNLFSRSISENENYNEDIPLRNIGEHILFGLIALFLGYIFVFYFVKIPAPHGEILPPSEEGISLYDFLKQTLGIPDIAGAVLGSICSLAPLIFKQRIRALMRKLKINRVY